MKSALVIYLSLLALAAFEAFTPTAYLIPGTLGVAAAGGFVQAGKLNAPLTISVVWLGILIGDLASFLLARKFGDVLRRWKSIAAVLGRAESKLRSHPIAFMFLSRLSPFLKNAAAPAAGLVGWPLRRFLALEVVAALIDATWFLAIGYVVSASIGSVTEIPLAARIIGVVALLAVVSFFIGRGRKCRLPRTSPSALLKAKRSFGFLLKCLLLVGPWELGGRLAKRAGFYDKPEYRAALAAAVELAQPGDVVLVGRTIDAPWGRFSHAMLVVSTPVGKALIHGYESGVQLTPVKAAPMCGKVAVVRFECSQKQRDTMVEAAWSQLATPFKLGSRRPSGDSPVSLNCIGLVAWAVSQAGLTLIGIPDGSFLVPDDVLMADNSRLIFEWQDGDQPFAPPISTFVGPVPKSPELTDEGTTIAEGAISPTSLDGRVELLVRSELFLGMARNDGRTVTEAEMSMFVDEEVIPKFPSGTTQISAAGTYESQTAGVIHEPSRLLTILHPNNLGEQAKIREIAAAYRTRFHQEMVLITMSPALVFSV